jgi:hypothetical protein
LDELLNLVPSVFNAGAIRTIFLHQLPSRSAYLSLISLRGKRFVLGAHVSNGLTGFLFFSIAAHQQLGKIVNHRSERTFEIFGNAHKIHVHPLLQLKDILPVVSERVGYIPYGTIDFWNFIGILLCGCLQTLLCSHKEFGGPQYVAGSSITTRLLLDLPEFGLLALVLEFLGLFFNQFGAEADIGIVVAAAEHVLVSEPATF